MATTQRILSRCAAFAKVLSEYVGTGDGRIPIQSVASRTSVHEDTVINYMVGETLPRIDWMVALEESFGATHPSFIAAVWAALDWRTEPRPLAVQVLDADGDGRLDADDARKHRERAAVSQVQNMAECADRSCADDVEKRDHETRSAIQAAAQVEEHLRMRSAG